jgi:DNA-binding transcriptional MerR regulator
MTASRESAVATAPAQDPGPRGSPGNWEARRCRTGRTYSVREIVALAQCTRDLLSYYEQIALLAPRKDATDGSEGYDDLDLLRLQQIRIGRSRGLALEEIRRWLDGCAGPFPSDLPRSILPPGASSPSTALYFELEVKVETECDRLAFQDEASGLYSALSMRWRSGGTPTDARLERWVERHRCHIERWFCPCEARRHAAFARAIANNSVLAASIERHGSRLSHFMLSVIEANSP